MDLLDRAIVHVNPNADLDRVRRIRGYAAFFGLLMSFAVAAAYLRWG